MPLFEIPHRLTGAVIFKLDCASPQLCLEAAVEDGSDLRCADLGDAKLPGAKLGGARLGGADLWGADLKDADLSAADLRGADLWGADLGKADLRAANLRGADLRGADLKRAKLADANFMGADLLGADLREADLGDANLWTAKRLDEIKWGDDQTTSIPPLFIFGQSWPVMISDRHIRIGCHVMTTEEWRALEGEALRRLGEDADETAWATFKAALLALADAHQSQVSGRDGAGPS